MKKAIIIIFPILAGMVFAFALNFFVLEEILIPDPCYYHSHDTNAIFDIFYDLPASEGFHPFPTTFNFVFTMIIGATAGLIFSIYMQMRCNKKKRKQMVLNKLYDKLLPPWTAFPDMFQGSPRWNQGYEEDYCRNHWIPYWKNMSDEERAKYCDKHNAPKEWVD